MEKKCKRCDFLKNVEFFGKNKNNKDGISSYCKDCELIRAKEYREKNREKVNQSSKNWRKNNPEKYKETVNRYLVKNPDMLSKERIKKYRQNDDFLKKMSEKRKEYYQNNIESAREYRKKYYENNKIKERKKNDDWRKTKLKEDGFFRMKKRLRDRVRDYMKGENINKKTSEIIGLDYDDFKTYISNKFEEGMSWENYGKWHIDHIKPLCEAKSINELFELNHYNNLQPLWAEDNLKKNRKYGN